MFYGLLACLFLITTFFSKSKKILLRYLIYMYTNHHVKIIVH